MPYHVDQLGDMLHIHYYLDWQILQTAHISAEAAFEAADLGHDRESICAAEREACAKIAEEYAVHHDFWDGGFDVGEKIAAAIRARGEH